MFLHEGYLQKKTLCQEMGFLFFMRIDSKRVIRFFNIFWNFKTHNSITNFKKFCCRISNTLTHTLTQTQAFLPGLRGSWKLVARSWKFLGGGGEWEAGSWKRKLDDFQLPIGFSHLFFRFIFFYICRESGSWKQESGSFAILEQKWKA